MKKMLLLLAACLLLPGAVRGESEEAMRVALQEKLMELDEAYGDELSREERMQLSFYIDWADRYVQDTHCEWKQFGEDFGQCESAQELAALLEKEYIGVTQAPEGQTQREEIRQRCAEILEAAGLDSERVPYVSIGHKGIRENGESGGWLVYAADMPGEERYTPHIIMEFDGQGKLSSMEYIFEQAERVERNGAGASVDAVQARDIACRFAGQYVSPDEEVMAGEAQGVYEGEIGDPYWEILCETEDSAYRIDVGSETGCVYGVDPD